MRNHDTYLSVYDLRLPAINIEVPQHLTFINDFNRTSIES